MPINGAGVSQVRIHSSKRLLDRSNGIGVRATSDLAGCRKAQLLLNPCCDLRNGDTARMARRMPGSLLYWSRLALPYLPFQPHDTQGSRC